ncbi:MAG: FeoB-associated Cys-rich membrane protein [Fervidobacterium gondwanense]
MDSTFVILLVIFIIVSDAIVLFVIYRFRKKKKEQENLVEDYINGHGYRYIAREDKTFQKEFSKTFSKLNPNFRWKNLSIKHIFMYSDSDNSENQTLFFELEVTGRNYYRKYLCLLADSFTSELPEFAIIPKEPFGMLFSKGKDIFSRLYDVKPKQVIEMLSQDLKDQIIRYSGITILYTKNKLLIAKEYKSKEGPLEALTTCEEIFDIVKMYNT